MSLSAFLTKRADLLGGETFVWTLLDVKGDSQILPPIHFTSDIPIASLSRDCLPFEQSVFNVSVS